MSKRLEVPIIPIMDLSSLLMGIWKVNRTPDTWASHSIVRCVYPREIVTCPSKNLYTNVYSNLIHKKETGLVANHRRMDRQTAVKLYNEMQFCSKKSSIGTYNNIDSYHRYVKWKKDIIEYLLVWFCLYKILKFQNEQSEFILLEITSVFAWLEGTKRSVARDGCTQELSMELKMFIILIAVMIQ